MPMSGRWLRLPVCPKVASSIQEGTFLGTRDISFERFAAESEREAQEQSSRTAIALESMASWIEQAEVRLTDTARASADQQDRIAAILSQALSSMKERLDIVERQVASERAAPPRVAIAVGNEGAGLTDEVRLMADRLVSIPIAAGVESLNVAVAAGILLHQLRA